MTDINDTTDGSDDRGETSDIGSARPGRARPIAASARMFDGSVVGDSVADDHAAADDAAADDAAAFGPGDEAGAPDARTGDDIASGLFAPDQMAERQALLIDELARALLSTSEAFAAIRPEPSARALVRRDRAVAQQMPQVLQSMAAGAGRADRHRDEIRRSVVVPLEVALVGAAAAAGGLLAGMIWVSGIDLAMVPGLQEVARPGASVQSLVPVAGMHRAAVKVETIAVPAYATPIDPAGDDVMLARGADLIAHGDILAARALFEQAAKDGSLAAHFALAETFDPNTLAAWGERDQVADVASALRHYHHALSVGDTRAARRIEALVEDR